MRGRARHFVLYGRGKVWSDGATTMHRGLGLTIALLGLPGCFTDSGAGSAATGSSGEASTGTSSGSGTGTSSSSGVVPTGSDTGVPTTSSGTTGPMDGDACDPWTPVCPEGSKCAAYSQGDGVAWDANKCVPAGEGTPGMGCIAKDSATSGQDTCAVGGMCWDVDPDKLTGVCFALCGGTKQAPSCPPGSSCFRTNGGVVNLCVPECDPLNLAQCAGVCVFDPQDGQFICLLDASGTTDVDDPCDFINGCPAGSLCEDPARSTACAADAGGCCLAYCDVKGGGPPCPMDHVCEAFAGGGAPVPGHENLGLCVVPVMP